jgi:CRISPR-associated endonuclease Csn1
MGKILGLDLGTNSIGWAVVDEEEQQIIDTGVRIFPEAVDNLGQGEREISKNAQRRAFRQQRRGYFRHKIRRIHLLRTLIELEMCPLSVSELDRWSKYEKQKGKSGQEFPASKDFMDWLRLNPYELRAKSLNEKISRLELGRVFYHLIQRRGFLSNRKSKDTGAIFKGKENMKGIEETQQEIEDATLGKYLHSIYPKQNKSYYDIKDEEGNHLRIRARYTLRDMYIDEFEKIWNVQAPLHNLDIHQKEIRKVRYLKGTASSKRGKKKIEYLQNKYGVENVIIEGKKITTSETLCLKDFFGGETDEDGTIIREKSNDSLLFYQRPLRSQKGLLAKCSIEGKKYYNKKEKRWYESGPTPAHVSHPEFEEYRALQFINNIEYGNRQKLDNAQRKLILELFNSKKAAFKFSEIPKVLELGFETFNYPDDFSVATNTTIASLSSLFPEKIWEKNKNEIWNCFNFYSESQRLTEKLQSLGLKEKNFETALKKIDKISLKEGYASVSLKAIRNIIPFLRKGYTYSEAVVLGGVRNAFKRKDNSGNNTDLWAYFTDSHEDIENKVIEIIRDKKNKEGQAIKRIKEYLANPENDFGFSKNDKRFKKLYHHSQEVVEKTNKDKLETIENLRNPVVQQALNELRRLVNHLIEKNSENGMTYKFDKIKVELARDLKAGKQKRQEISLQNNENNKKNEEARERLTEYGLKHSRNNIHKYLMFEEIQQKNGLVRCPYSNKVVNIAALLGRDNEFQIEHIFPRSTSLNDSFANKTICDAKFNQLKGNKTPYQFYKENADPKLWGANSWDEISRRAFSLLPYHKAKRFTAKSMPEKSDFIERQLNDTRYISKKTKEILTQISDDVRVFPGAVTSKLRSLWGLNSILQPVQVYDFTGAQIDEEKASDHWLLLDETDKPLGFYPVQNPKPKTEKHDIALPVYVKKNKAKSAFINEIKADGFNDGKYWAVMRLGETPESMVKRYVDTPEKSDDEIVLKGSIKNGKFTNNNLGTIAAPKQDAGAFWSKFKIKKLDFYPKDKKPKAGKNKIALYGTIDNARFKSYIYECVTDKGDGAAWAEIEIEPESATFIKAENPLPEIMSNQIIVQGTIDERGLFTSDFDNDFVFEASSDAGKYRAVFNIVSKPKLLPVYNEQPETSGKQKLLEGKVRVDRETGEIQFDPKKNRDDNRHHAVDAIVAALTEQTYLQKMSTLHANADNKKRGNEYEKISFEEPWDGFYEDVKTAVAKILVSRKTNRNVLTNIRKIIEKNGRKYISKGKAARGQLHKEFVFGSRQSPGQEEAYHIRKTVGSLTAAQIKKIADPIVRKIVTYGKEEEKKINAEIKKLEGKIKKSNTDNREEDLRNEMEELQQRKALLFTLSNRKGGDPVPIKKVRIRENLGNTERLKDLKVFAEKKEEKIPLAQYVNLRNNHHAAIYKNHNNAYIEKIVTFWEAVERKKQKMPVIDKTHQNEYEFVTSLQRDDMFLLGLNHDEINWDKPDYERLSRHLFRVQKISSMYYSFRHHLASSINNDSELITIQSFSAWKSIKPIKVFIGLVGNLQKYIESSY